MKSIKSKE